MMEVIFLHEEHKTVMVAEHDGTKETIRKEVDTLEEALGYLFKDLKVNILDVIDLIKDGLIRRELVDMKKGIEVELEFDGVRMLLPNGVLLQDILVFNDTKFTVKALKKFYNKYAKNEISNMIDDRLGV